MLSLAQMTADVRAMFADLPQTLTLSGGQTVSGVVTTGPEADALSMTDVNPERRLTAVILVADCTTPPAVNDVILYNGGRYRIADVQVHDDGLAYTVQAAGEWQ